MPKVPASHGGSHGGAAYTAGLDPSRVALIIETRPSSVIPALLSHFIATVPPAWIVKMVGTPESFSVVEKARSLQQHIASRKLELQYLPSYWPMNSSETVSQTLTNLTFYADFLAPAEWLLMFQTDSIICAASEQSIDDWVAKNYSWVGAPWNSDVPGGNGGLSLRHIPSIVEVLQKESRPVGHPQWEDLWITERLKNAAPAKEELYFSVESLYVEYPLGYHLRGSGKLVEFSVWGNKTRKRHIFDYCPETKILMGNMDLEAPNDGALLKQELAADAEKAREDAGLPATPAAPADPAEETRKAEEEKEMLATLADVTKELSEEAEDAPGASEFVSEGDRGRNSVASKASEAEVRPKATQNSPHYADS
jgi:hypothetical protein